MGREANQIKTVQLTISTTEAVVRNLKQLVATGFYGKNATEAAERLLAQSLAERLSGKRRSVGGTQA